MYWIFGALQQVYTASANIIKAGAHLIYSTFNTVKSFILTSAKAAVMTLVGVIAGLVAAFKVFVQSTQALARDIASIRNQTGLGNARSANLVWQMRAFGIGGSDLAQMASNPANNPMLFRMRAGGLGLPGYESANFIPALNRWFQSHSQNPMQRMFSNSLLNNYLFQGGAPAGIMQAANMNPQQVAAQSSWVQKTMSTIGIDPDMLARYADELPLITTRIGLTIDMLKVKFSTLLLPMLERFLNFISGNIGDNLDGIVQFIQNVARWMWVELPDYMVKGAGIGVQAITWLVDAFFWMAQGAVNLLKALEDSNSGLNQFISGFLQVVDWFINAGVAVINVFRDLGVVINNVVAEIYNVFQSLMGWLANLSIPSKAALLYTPLAPMVLQATKMKSAGYDFSSRMEKREFSDPFTFNSDLAGGWSRIQKRLSKAAPSEAAQRALDSWRESATSGLGSLSNSYEKFARAMGSKEEREKGFDKMVAATNKNTDAVKGVENAVRGLSGDSSGLSGMNVLSRILSYVDEDSYRALVSSQ